MAKFVKRYNKGRFKGKGKYKRKSAGNKMTQNAITIGSRKNWLGLPFPQRMITHFDYTDFGQLVTTATVATPNIEVYQMNSLYAPGGSENQQPRYRDQLLGVLYQKYRVYGISYRCSFITSGTQAGICSVTPFNGPYPTLVTSRDLIEYPHTKHSMLGTGGANWHCKDYISLPKLTGRTSEQYSSDDIYASDYGASPSEAMQLVIAVSSANRGTAIICDYEISIRFHCELYDPIESTASS